MKLFQFYLLLVLIVCQKSSLAQVIMQDSRGKDIFEYYKGGSLQATFIPSQVSMQLNYNFVIGSPYYFYVNRDTADKTVGKSNSISVVGKVTGSGSNQGKPYNINNGLVRPSYKLEVGYQKNLNTFYDIDLVPNRFTYTWGINAYGDYQNVNFYDSSSKIRSNERPVILGLHSHVTWFETRTGIVAVSLSADIARSYKQDDLLPFQERSSGTYIDQNVISIGDVIGNIGAFDKATAYRLRVSVPLFVTKWISITPYTAVYGYLDDQSNILPGIAFNFFNGTPSEPNSSIAQGFGIGVDWLKSKGKWSSAKYSLYGSLNLDLLRKTILGRAL